MRDIALGKIEKFIVHFVGNKNNDDGVRFADELTSFENIEPLLERLLNNSFKMEELYQFFFNPSLELNPVYQFCNSIFTEEESFLEQSKNSARYLYDKSTHPNIRGGELCMIYLKNCQVQEEIVDGIVIFKSENKDTILNIGRTKTGFMVTDVAGININKFNKACLIFNTEKQDGFLVHVVDNSTKAADAKFWKDDFLSIRQKKSDYQLTNQFLGITRQFIAKQLSEDTEISKADQIDILNKSVDYFKKNDIFNKQEFEEEVFSNGSVIDSFRKFDLGYRKDNEIGFSDNFQISNEAVKKQSKIFKGVLKLDKNFDIYIHGDKDKIEKGVEKDGRKFYKIYYDVEK